MSTPSCQTVLLHLSSFFPFSLVDQEMYADGSLRLDAAKHLQWYRAKDVLAYLHQVRAYLLDSNMPQYDRLQKMQQLILVLLHPHRLANGYHQVRSLGDVELLLLRFVDESLLAYETADSFVDRASFEDRYNVIWVYWAFSIYGIAHPAALLIMRLKKSPLFGLAAEYEIKRSACAAMIDLMEDPCRLCFTSYKSNPKQMMLNVSSWN